MISFLDKLPSPPPGKTGWPWTVECDVLPQTMPDGKPWPKISIVTPSFNYAQYVEETIRSVLLQGYPNIEYVIIDGGSRDGSANIIQEYSRFLSFWISEPDRGQADAINKGFERCTGDLFSWLNADDAFLRPGCLQEIATRYGEGYDVIMGRTSNVDGDDNPIAITREYNGWAPVQSFEEYVRFWSFIPFPQPSVIVSRRLAEYVFPLDIDLQMTMDYQMFLRVLRRRPRIISLDEQWIKFRYHGSNKTMANCDDNNEHYRVAVAEANVQFGLFKRSLFRIRANDYIELKGLMSCDDKPKGLLRLLIKRPSLLAWSLFWKIFLRERLGHHIYDLLKNRWRDWRGANS